MKSKPLSVLWHWCPPAGAVAVCSLLWFASAGLASAEEVIPFPADKYPVGTTFVFRETSGGTERLDDVVLVEKQVDRIRLDATGRPPAAPNPRSVIINADGNTTHVAYASGREVTYTPHNCSRTIGECAYVLTEKDGTSRRWRSRATLKDCVREAMVFDERGFVMVESRVTVDADGLAARIVSRQPNTTDPSWSERELIEVIPPSR